MNIISTLFVAAIVLKWVDVGYPATLGWFWIIGWWVVASVLALFVKSYLEALQKAREDRQVEEFVKALRDED